jgi:hypothetical protein
LLSNRCLKIPWGYNPDTKGANGVKAKFVGIVMLGPKKKVIWVPKSLVTNLQGPKQVWVPKKN